MADDTNQKPEDYPQQGDVETPDEIDHEEGVSDTPPEEPVEDRGEQSPVGGSTPKPDGESSDDMVADITGGDPLPGQTIADIINKAERDRHSK